MTERADGVRVLHRDADLLVLYKPAGLATTSPDGRNCLTEIAAQLDPRAPRLHASSRLDAEVTGLVTFARTTRAIEGLLAARRAGEYERYYLGLATGPLDPIAGELDWPIDRDPRDPRKRIARDRPKPSAASNTATHDLTDARAASSDTRGRGAGAGSASRDSASAEARAASSDTRGRGAGAGSASRDSASAEARAASSGTRGRGAGAGSASAEARAASSGTRGRGAGAHVATHDAARALSGRAPRKDQAQDARTRYRVIELLPTAALLLLSPLTGRTHQLRVHVARAGAPLLGDRHYGGPTKIVQPNGRVVRAARVMLHCARVRIPAFDDPAEKLTLNAPIPDDMRALWQALGGDPAAFERALDAAQSQS